MSYVLIVFGVILQVGGLIVAGRDVRKTRQAYAPGSLGVEDRVWIWVKKKILHPTRNWFRKHFAQRKGLVIQGVSGTVEMKWHVGMAAVGLASYPPTDKKLTVREQARLLDIYVQSLQGAIHQIETAQREDRARIDAAERTIETSALDLRALTDERVGALALSGLGNQTAGLWVTALGVVIALVGEILQWLPASA